MSKINAHDEFLEESVIAILLRFPDRFYDCGVTEDHFYLEHHKRVIRSYMEKGPSLMSVRDCWGGGMEWKAMELSESVWSDSSLEQHLKALDELSSVRKVAAIAQRLLDRLMDSDASEIRELACSAAGDIAMAVSGETKTMSEGAESVDVLNQPGGEEVSTHLDGFPVRRKELIGIAARPGCGKTSMIHSAGEHAIATREGPFVIFTMEVTRKEWFQRTMRQVAGRGVKQYKQDGSPSEEYIKFSQIVRERYLKGVGKLIVDEAAGLSVEQMRSRCIALQAKHGKLSGVGVDQLSNMKRDVKKYGSMTAAIQHDTSELKKLSRELDCPIFVASQFNRTPSGEDDWYTERDIFGSDALLQDADQLWLLQNHPGSNIDQDVRRVNLRRCKWRNGHLGEADLDFDTPSSTFRKGF